MITTHDTWTTFTGPHGAAGRRNLATGQTIYAPIVTDVFTEQAAVPGHDGEQVEQLLDSAKRQGADLIHRLSRQAMRRIIERVAAATSSPIISLFSGMRFFDTYELAQLADLLRRINVTADLLGRARIRIRHHDQTPADQPTNFSRLEKFDELDRLRPLPPLQAIDYFRGLTPGLKIDLFQFDLPTFEQQAFTLAVTTDQKILERVQAIILDRLETGKALAIAPATIDEILDEAGVGSVRNGYGEMVLRTNMMESYRTGAWREYSDPDLAEDYPVWRYIGIHDGRERHGNEPHAHRPAPADKPDHLRWFGQHFVRAVEFFQVRGTDAADVINCRCDFIPIYKTDVKKLLMQGMRPIDNWQEIKAADTYTEDLWLPYIGPHHGHGWQNRHTGAIIYGDHHPGSHHALAQARAEGHTWHTIAQRTGLPVTTIRARLRAHNRINSGLPAGLKSKAASPEAYHRAIETEESKHAIRREWVTRAHEEGIESTDLHALARDLVTADAQDNEDMRNMLQSAYRKTGLTGARLGAHRGLDHASIPGFDAISRELAGQYPHILGDHGFSHDKAYDPHETEAAERLHALMMQGPPEPLDENEAYSRAFHILADQHYHSGRQHQRQESNAVPFTEKWAPYHGPKGGEGWRNLATGEIIYQKEQPGSADAQPRPQGAGLWKNGSKWANNFRDFLHTHNASPNEHSDRFTLAARDKLTAAYTQAVRNRIAAVRTQIEDQHGPTALDSPAWKLFLRKTADMETRFERLAAAMTEHAQTHARGSDHSPAAIRTFRRGLQGHAAKLSAESARHADTFNAAHRELLAAIAPQPMR